jgi:O-antigen/teichoic acid export membrane protein
MIANYAGQGWSALMALLFAPVYIQLLGIEAYGLIGFFTTLQVWLTLLDLGILPTSVREMARFTSGAVTVQATRDLLRSFELICLGIALLLALALALGAGPIAVGWLNARAIPDAAAAQAIALMGVVLAARLGEGLYRSCLAGLQRQVWLNGASAILATLRAVGAVAILYWVDRSVQAFFIWQAGVSLLSVAVLGLAVHRHIPPAPRRARFSAASLASVGRFAGGMLGISLLSLLLTQVDKLMLARLLPLDQYGYYMLAAAVVGAMYMFSTPVTQAVYPVMVEQVAAGDEAKLAGTFHRAAQLLTAILSPIGLVLALFSRPLLFAWTGDAVLADATAPLVSLLAIGTLANTLLQLPYFAQLAYGWTGLALRINIGAVLILIPAILWLVPKWGGLAAAGLWALLNLGYLLLTPIMFRRILRGEQWRWYVHDLAKPTAAALVLLVLARLVPIDPATNRWLQGAFVVLAGGLACAAALATVDGAIARTGQIVRLATRRGEPR